mgnify:CR=1 FL=1
MCSKKGHVNLLYDIDNNIDDIDNDHLEQLQDKCGVFACIANGDWPTNLDVAHIICLGLVGLQHRFVFIFHFPFCFFFAFFQSHSTS